MGGSTEGVGEWVGPTGNVNGFVPLGTESMFVYPGVETVKWSELGFYLLLKLYLSSHPSIHFLVRLSS